MSPDPHSFTPRQLRPSTAELSAEITGSTTEQVAAQVLALLPPLGPGSVVLDNGSRGGFLTDAIMRSDPPPDLVVSSVDPDPSMVAMAGRRGAAAGWPQETFVMAPEALSFPDERFTHSFTNFLLPYTPHGGLDAARQIHRTLRQGGTAVVSTWAELPHQRPLQAAHAATRGSAAPLPLGVPDRWYQASHVQEVLRAGGLGDTLPTTTVDARLQIPDVRHWVTSVWSSLGAPAGGWTERDEQDWDRAIAVLMAGVEQSPGFTPTDDGGMEMSLTANITVARK